MSARVRIGVLVPPGNPTVEPELYRMAPAGVTIHFARLDPGNALGDAGSIYDETEERAYELARQADAANADAVLLSGTGLPTIGVLDRLERELGKPVVSSIQACLWRALRVADRYQAIDGFGRLLR